MSNVNELSVEELRAESERTRAELAATVRELQLKTGSAAEDLKTLVSPENIRNEAKAFVREERQSLADSVRRKVKDNPLQAAAVGAAMAYPALGLLRSLPAPLLLIGAGLFLTSQRGRQTAEILADKVETVAGKAAENVGVAAETVADMKDRVVSDIQDRVAGARYGIEEVRDNVVSGAEEMADKARRSAHDLGAAVTRTVENAAGSTDAVTATVSNAAVNGADGARNAGQSLSGFLKENALLLAGAGAAVGVFVAASIPATRAEKQMFAKSGEALRTKVRETAAKGIESVSDIAAAAAGSAAAAAAREGIDAAGLQQTLNTVADRVRNVADHGLDAALDSKAGVQPDKKGNAP